MTHTPSPVTAPKPSVLVVDDLVANLQLLAEALDKHGYEPRPVSNGQLALRAARMDRPDLVLLDVRMPEMDGLELCRHLKADPGLADVPVIFITGATDTEDKVKAFAAGAVDYVTKPFQVEEVVARLSVHLKIQSLQRQLRNHNENLERLVAQRTRELEQAYERQLEVNRLKDDFLRMIAHEIRTPANGLLGMGELILDLCPPSDKSALFGAHFRNSSRRLRDLIEDATTIAHFDRLVQGTQCSLSFAELLDRTGESLPEIEIRIDPRPEFASALLQGDPGWLKKSFATMIRVAASFSQDPRRVLARGVVGARDVEVQLSLDALSLSAEQVADFFQMESPVRSASPAEPLGLAPVVAHKIVTAVGGEVSLVRKEKNLGALNVIFRRLQDPPLTETPRA